MKPKIDEDGESYWVFESRDVGLLRFLRDLRNLVLTAPMVHLCQPSRPANPVDSK